MDTKKTVATGATLLLLVVAILVAWAIFKSSAPKSADDPPKTLAGGGGKPENPANKTAEERAVDDINATAAERLKKASPPTDPAKKMLHVEVIAMGVAREEERKAELAKIKLANPHARFIDREYKATKANLDSNSQREYRELKDKLLAQLPAKEFAVEGKAILKKFQDGCAQSNHDASIDHLHALLIEQRKQLGE